MRLEVPDERLDLTEFVDLREVTDVLAHELLAAERSPPPREAPIALREGLREATMLPQRFPFLFGDPARGPHDPDLVRKTWIDELTDRERMHPIEQIAPHEAVAPPAVDVETGTPGHEELRSCPVGVEEPLEKRLPLSVLVDLIDEGHPGRRRQPLESEPARRRGGPGENHAPVVGVVPIERFVGSTAARGRLPHLTRASDECHLAILSQMPTEHRVVDPFPGNA
jgi:hypothetical protein